MRGHESWIGVEDAAAMFRQVGLHQRDERHEGVLPRVVYRAENHTSGECDGRATAEVSDLYLAHALRPLRRAGAGVARFGAEGGITKV